MPTEEQMNQEWIKKITKQAEQSEANDTPNESSYEEAALDYMKKTLQVMRQAKPEIRSERARRYAVAITEMEKLFAYFKVYIVDFID
jgi:hypothetical protein